MQLARRVTWRRRASSTNGVNNTDYASPRPLATLHGRRRRPRYRRQRVIRVRSENPFSNGISRPRRAKSPSGNSWIRCIGRWGTISGDGGSSTIVGVKVLFSGRATTGGKDNILSASQIYAAARSLTVVVEVIATREGSRWKAAGPSSWIMNGRFVALLADIRRNYEARDAN